MFMYIRKTFSLDKNIPSNCLEVYKKLLKRTVSHDIHK